MHQNTIFIAISALHVSGFSSQSSGAQETCIRFVRVVVVKDERGVVGSISRLLIWPEWVARSRSPVWIYMVRLVSRYKGLCVYRCVRVVGGGGGVWAYHEYEIYSLFVLKDVQKTQITYLGIM
jgi:hypothetical protein